MDVNQLSISRACQKVLSHVWDLFKNGQKTRAQNLLAEHRPRWTPEERVQSFLLEGEYFIRLRLLEEALAAHKTALITTREIRAAAKDPLRLVIAEPFLMITIILLFQKAKQDRLTQFLKSLARSPLFGLDFLRRTAEATRRTGYSKLEVRIWETYLKHNLPKKEQWSALVEKGIALLMSRNYQEAKRAFHVAARLFPQEHRPYGLLTAIAATEGNIQKARYFCNSSWTYGNRNAPYLRYRFILLLSEERFDLADETFCLLTQNTREILQTLFNNTFLVMHPCMLRHCEMALPKFKTYLTETHRRLSHKMQTCIGIVESECLKARGIYDYNHTFTLPLVNMFWNIDVKPLYNLPHEECLYQLEPHSEREVETFRTQYGNIIDRTSFEKYVETLRKQRRVVGLTLLTASTVIDMLAKVLEECEVAFQGVVRFDPGQSAAFTFQHGEGIVFGKHIVDLGDMDAIETIFRTQITQSKGA